MRTSEALFQLLIKLFPDALTLSRFIRLGEQGEMIARNLPSHDVALVQYVDAVVSELHRRGLVPATILRLRQFFPRRVIEIDEVAALWQSQQMHEHNRSASPIRHLRASHLRPLQWLHISDLHLGSQSEAHWWGRLDIFWRSLENWLKRLGPPDLILLTGDLTFQGSRLEFEWLTRFLDMLQKRLPTTPDGASPIILPVPGNHDLQRPTGKHIERFSFIEKCRNDSNYLSQSFQDSKTHDAIRSLFANYSDWFEQTITPRLIRPGVAFHQSSVPGDFWIELNLPERLSLGVLGLNSAWSQYSASGAAGNLLLPIEQVRAALPAGENGSLLETFSNVHYSLLMMHHPPDWLSPASRYDLDGLIYSSNRFVASLHGHLHEAPAVRSSSGRESCVIYQAPSLFGSGQFNAADYPRAIGYAWGRLYLHGELRAWPLRLFRKGDSQEVFDRDQLFYWGDEDNSVILRQGANPAETRSLRHLVWGSQNAALTLPDAAKTSSAFEVYQKWIMNQELSERFNDSASQVYVPTRLRSLFSEELEFDVDLLFRRVQTSHILIFGLPGSGKTTALQRLLYTCFREGPEMLGLARGTVPVLLRLHNVTEFRTDQTLSAWLDEIAKCSNGVLPSGFGDTLWNHGKLLLLIDGLDEIADTGLRTRVCRHLEAQLEQPEAKQIRVVISSRPTGQTIQLGRQFSILEMMPLKLEAIRTLIRRWFSESAGSQTNASFTVATTRAEALISAIEAPTHSGESLRMMASTPLLLNLLCNFVQRGREIPRGRAAFYQECLDLLPQWRPATESPPIREDRVMPLLRELAYAFQLRQPHDAIKIEELIAQLNRQPEGVEEPGFARPLVEWLHRDLGILQEISPNKYLFLHRGLQEFLTASYIAWEHDEGLARGVLERIGDPSWREVAQLLVAMPGSNVSGVLIKHLLQSPSAHSTLLRELLEEAVDGSPTPFLERLSTMPSSDDALTLIQLLQRFSDIPQVATAVRGFSVTTKNTAIRREAELFGPVNPFNPGSPLLDEKSFVGRGSLIEELFALVNNRIPSAIIGPRRSGKTWLLRLVEHRLKSIRPVFYVTLEGASITTSDDLALLLTRSYETEHLRVRRNRKQQPKPSRALLDRVVTDNRPIFLIDEVAHLHRADHTVFPWLRAFGQGSATIVLAGSHLDWVSVLKRASEVAPGSSFGNDVTVLPLDPISEDDAIAFLIKTSRGVITEIVASWIVEMCGPWPFYLQALGYSVIQSLRAGERGPLESRSSLGRLYEQKLLLGRRAVFEGRWKELPCPLKSVLLAHPSTRPDLFSLPLVQRQLFVDSGLCSSGGRWINDPPFFDWIRMNAGVLSADEEET